MTFAGRPQVVTDWTSDRAAISEALNTLAMRTQEGPTALYDACFFGLEKLSRASNTKRVLILITDGIDNVYGKTYQDLREHLKHSQAIIYSVFMEQVAEDALNDFARGILREITSNSGGVVLSALNNDAVPGALERMAEELHHQYTIGFKPTSPDGKWHTLKVKLQPDEIEDTSNPRTPRRISIKAHTRQGYFATANR